MQRHIKTLVTVLSLTLLLLASCRNASPSQPPAPPVPNDGPTVTITLTARGLAFDQSSLTVPAGAKVNLTLVNNETFAAHDFVVYESSEAARVIFRGDYISGGKTINYQFTAPSEPGTYYFRCDLHPTLMHGDFIVTAAQGK